MGIVYKAYHPALKRTVALKVLIAGEDASEEAIRRFHREAEAVAKLGHHPNIVPVYDIGTEGRNHYFAMHYVEGKSLDRMIDDAEIAPKRAAEIAMKLAGALHHAHQHGVLHRDIKPANVLMRIQERPRAPEIPNLNGKKIEGAAHVGGWDLEVGGSAREGGEPMLTDFGLAKDVASESKMTRSGLALGTPAYMPPEQAKGLLEEVNERSDIYALGATLYEMLVLRPPFKGNSMGELIRKILFADPVSPRKHNRLVAKNLETICLKCLEKDPARRYPDAQALAKDLERFLKREPIHARPPSTLTKASRRIRRNKAVSAILLVLVVVLCTAGGFAWWGAKLRRAEREALVREGGKTEEAKREAEGEARTADEMLTKSRAASLVLRSADTKLGDVLRELERSFYSAKPPEEIRRTGDRCWEKIRAFEAGVPADSASQAAWLAAKGWMRRLAGYPEASFDLFKASREKDPDIAYGQLFEGMVWLSTYLKRQSLPEVSLLGKRIVVDEPPAEKEEMREARQRFQALLEEATKKRVWGESSAMEFQRVLQGFRGVQRGDLEAAEKGLTTALAIPEMAWLVLEIRLVRAKVRYWKMEFRKGLEDVEKVIEAYPERSHLYSLKGGLWRGAGFRDYAEGRNPQWAFQKAIETYDTLIRLAPGAADGYNERGITYLALFNDLKRRGGDSRSAFEKAVADFNEVLRRYPGHARGFFNRGTAYNALGDIRMDRGEDSQEAYRMAIRDYSEAIRRAPLIVMYRYNRAVATVTLGEAVGDAGGDSRGHLRKAIEELDGVLRGNPGRLEVPSRVNRGHAYTLLGRALILRREDPMDAFRRGLEDFNHVERLDPSWREVHSNRGNLYFLKGTALYSVRGDPREAFKKAIEDFSKVLPGDRDHQACLDNKLLAWIFLGEAESARGKDARPIFRKAVEEGKAILRHNPKRAQVNVHMGQVYMQLGLEETRRGRDGSPYYEKSRYFYEEALRIEPSQWGTYWKLGELMELWDRFEDAVQAYKKALALTRGSIPGLKEILARAQRLAGMPRWARELLQADTAVRKKDYTRARALYEKALPEAMKDGALENAVLAPLMMTVFANLARIYAVASAGKATPHAVPKPLSPEGAASLREKALAHLRRAFEMGYTDLARVREDPDFIPLQGHPGYSDLLNEWEAFLKKGKGGKGK
jgi:tetratricopeptide (TPR) repeat protein